MTPQSFDEPTWLKARREYLDDVAFTLRGDELAQREQGFRDGWNAALASRSPSEIALQLDGLRQAIFAARAEGNTALFNAEQAIAAVVSDLKAPPDHPAADPVVTDTDGENE